MDPQTLYLAALVSQATFALSLSLLAWSDRRSKGLVWLAAACALQFCWTATVTSGRSTASHFSQSVGAGLLVVLFFMVYMGFHWFTVRSPLRSALVPALVVVSLVLVGLISVGHPMAGQNFGRLVAASLGVVTIHMLWTTKITALRSSARISAVLMLSVMGVMATRLLLNQPVERWRNDQVESSLVIREREVTTLLVTLLSFSFIGIYVAETNRRLHDETRMDSLTGLRNRRALEEAAIQAVRLAHLQKTPLALWMMDMDRFKDLNDTFGHVQGDRALQSLGAILLAAVGYACGPLLVNHIDDTTESIPWTNRYKYLGFMLRSDLMDDDAYMRVENKTRIAAERQ